MRTHHSKSDHDAIRTAHTGFERPEPHIPMEFIFNYSMLSEKIQSLNLFFNKTAILAVFVYIISGNNLMFQLPFAHLHSQKHLFRVPCRRYMNT